MWLALSVILADILVYLLRSIDFLIPVEKQQQISDYLKKYSEILQSITPQDIYNLYSSQKIWKQANQGVVFILVILLYIVDFIKYRTFDNQLFDTILIALLLYLFNPINSRIVSFFFKDNRFLNTLHRYVRFSMVVLTIFLIILAIQHWRIYGFNRNYLSSSDKFIILTFFLLRFIDLVCVFVFLCLFSSFILGLIVVILKVLSVVLKVCFIIYRFIVFKMVNYVKGPVAGIILFVILIASLLAIIDKALKIDWGNTT